MKNKIATSALLFLLAQTSAFASQHTTYECQSKTTHNLIILTPDFGEITTVDRFGETGMSIDGLHANIKIFESLPTKTNIAFVDEDGTVVASITESGSTILLKNFLYDTDKQIRCIKK